MEGKTPEYIKKAVKRYQQKTHNITVALNDEEYAAFKKLSELKKISMRALAIEIVVSESKRRLTEEGESVIL